MAPLFVLLLPDCEPLAGLVAFAVPGITSGTGAASLVVSLASAQTHLAMWNVANANEQICPASAMQVALTEYRCERSSWAM